jgi:AraC-like DNA-binding protein
MLYQEHLPHVLLQEFIECYWCLQSTDTNAPFHTVYPDGCMDIIFNFGDPLIRKDQSITEQNTASSFLVGNMLKPIQSRSLGCTNLLGIRFKPGGMSRFFPIPLHHFTDRSIPLYDVPEMFQRDLAEQLYSLNTTKRIQHLDKFFQVKASVSNEPWQRCLRQIVHTQASISTIAQQAGISQKQLQRKFLQNVGVSPKQLSQVLRFRALQQQLKNNPHESLMSLAWNGGFTDHAHLTKAFKTFAGITPSQYLAT